jgi:hypothetical protein
MKQLMTIIAIALVSLLQVGIVWTMAFIYANQRHMFWLFCALYVIMEVIINYDEVIDVE